MRKSCNRTREMAILPQLLAIESHFMRQGCARTSLNQSRNFTSVFGYDRTSFRAKRLRWTLCKWHFYLSFLRSNLVSCERVATGRVKSQFYLFFFGDRTACFVRKGCVSCRLVGTAPRLQERHRKEGESEQEGKRECEDVKM